jgi:heat-inducible transcriptional repressor
MDRFPESKISDRQRQILSIIIEEYVTTARPVASEHIVSRYGLAVSSATVRNDMAELERAGLIVQPHTSAGRVPSDRGYRYFVENLMNPTALPADEQRKISHQFHQVEMEADEWVRLAAAVLARSVHIAALATSPRSTAVRLKHFELLSISDTRIMIVLVGHDGAVSQQLLNVGETWDQNDLSTLSAQLNAHLEGLTPDEIREWTKGENNLEGLPSVSVEVVEGVANLLGKLERPETSQVYHDGLAHILDQPEFRDRDRMQRIIELFENGAVWSSIIPSVIGQEGVQVIIGDEGWGEGIAQCSVVLARYGLGNRLAGVLGVVGPMRMPYSRSVSTVGYMSRLLSDMVRKAYSSEIDDER